MLNNGVLSFSSPNNNVLGRNLVPGQVVRNTNSGNAMIVIGGQGNEQLGPAVRGPRGNKPAVANLCGWSSDPDGLFHVYPIYSEREYEVLDTITLIQA